MSAAPVLLTSEGGQQVLAPATGVFDLTWVLIALPLLGAIVLLAGGRRTNRVGPVLATSLVGVSFVIGFIQFLTMLSEPSDERAFVQSLFEWAPIGSFSVDVGFQLDPLSMCFVLLITFVGGLIHLYSIGYMADDPDRRLFFGYLNLFAASMLLLVLANNYVMVYVGWEGVGLASYLLIGFWNAKPEYATAAKKAFVMNRVGDIGMSLAIMLMVATFGTTAFTGVFAGVSEASSGVVLALGLLLLLAATGKSAQMPLQAWLGDAMAGPTPVSALIHAATMVTAGVYLIVRSNPIFDLSDGARLAVVLVGVLTLLFGAFVGTAKDDIKKALAASTMSQIGYMVLAAGLGPAGYAFAIFHLLTHGFFKAHLFLGAGSVMHGMNDEVNMRRYGALRVALPATFVTFFIGYLAIIGIPPFAGFFSKDKIIEAAMADNLWLGLGAILGAGVTAFYMTRVVIMTFYGDQRWADEAHPHESPRTMTIPMILLSLGSIALGFVLWSGNRIVDWLEPVVGPEEEHELAISPLALTGIILLVVLIGVAIAISMYARKPVPVQAPVGSPLTKAARKDFYQDAVNESVAMRPGQYLTRFLVFFDNRVVDGAVNATAAMFGGGSARLRRWQTGFVRSYALSMLGGAVLVVGVLVLVAMS
ncbi:MAG TPA: NADH-quinone oxidoreductase subunit L [Actinomycetes bacterium]|nr:NADH-quinone oxidoreductase subunit L [Actinomycetes bacterium]